MESVLELHQIGQPAPSGGWCPACRVPSLAERTWLAADVLTLVVVARVTETFCVDCGVGVLA